METTIILLGYIGVYRVLYRGYIGIINRKEDGSPYIVIGYIMRLDMEYGKEETGNCCIIMG